MRRPVSIVPGESCALEPGMDPIMLLDLRCDLRAGDELDMLHAWTAPVGSAVLAVPPGCAEGGFVGDVLFGDRGPPVWAPAHAHGPVRPEGDNGDGPPRRRGADEGD